jgi:chemotaxis protein MotB
MIRKLLVPVGALLIMSSCGNSKKLEAANAEISQLQSDNKKMQQAVDDLKKQVSDLTSRNSSVSDQLNGCQQNAQAAQRKLRAVQAAQRDQAEDMKRLQDKINAAMADFESKGVDIFFKDGQVFVEMADNLLYKSGSAVLSDSGKQALVHLAEVLNGYPDLKLTVMGNTDNVMFKKGSDNWTLSTERANGVVRVLRDANVNPERIVSAGKGKYNPVADNSTAEGRAKNRRTDIILNPDMVKLWEAASAENDK